MESLIAWAILAGVILIDGYRYQESTGHFGFTFQIERAASLGMYTFNPEAVFYPLSKLAVHCSYEEGVPNHFLKLFLGTVDHYGGIKLFSAFAPLGILALITAVAQRRLTFPVFWVIAIFIFYQYGFRGLQWDGGQGILHYYLVAHRPRYLHLLLPALTILLGYWVVEMQSRKRFAGALLVVLLVVPSLYRARQNHIFYRGSLQDLRGASRFLIDQQPAPVYSDTWGLEQLHFFTDGALTDLRALRDESPLEPGSWAVFGGSRGFDLSPREVASSLPSSYARYHTHPIPPPQNWRIAHTQKGLRNPARRSDLVIYQIQ
jgi:hypothetical protein